MSTHLVEYSSSDEEENEKLELPSALQVLDSDRLRFPVYEDDPAKHNFRTRKFPHETGPHLISRLLKAIDNPIIQSDLVIDNFHFMDSLHLSLSKTWPIYFHWIENLICNLRASISTFEKSFVTLLASAESHVALIPLLNSVDSCVTAFRGPEYYKVKQIIAYLFLRTRSSI
ncbi:unnamed protein product [Trichobilharzia regenti]|nr:unnamed protein product [Trichobilharzia regenti]